MTTLRTCAAAILAAVAAAILVAMAVPAAAEDPAPPASTTPDAVVRNVDISFDLGGYDDQLGDWRVKAVVVRGDMTDGELFTVQLEGSGERVLWSATQPFTNPVTTIPVDLAIAVGDITSAGVSQGVATPESVLAAEPPVVDHAAAPGASGSGQLALSMVLVIVVVAIVFRTPLPSASTQRWTR